jgi:hypothetical protein
VNGQFLAIAAGGGKIRSQSGGVLLIRAEVKVTTKEGEGLQKNRRATCCPQAFLLTKSAETASRFFPA